MYASVRRKRRILWAILLLAPALIGPLRPDDDIEITPDMVYAHKHRMALTMDVYQRKQSDGVGVLFMVSGGWFSKWAPPEQTRGLFKPLLDKGFTVFAVRHGEDRRADWGLRLTARSRVVLQQHRDGARSRPAGRQFPLSTTA